MGCSSSDEEMVLAVESEAVTAKDWTVQQDFVRLLDNPHKGWYHHVYDNGTQEYGPRQASDVFDFPGLDHLYVRIPWALLEPEQDVYDWSRIDELVETYASQGIGLAFAVTSKETSVPYGAPAWLRDLGVRMDEYEEWGLTFYEPDYGDPAFLAQLGEFQRAMAERYGQEDWLRYVQVASYGSWGEGHNWPHSDSTWSRETLTAHIDIFESAWPEEVTLTITDDWVGNAPTPADAAFYNDYISSREMTWTDHSVLVDYYVDNWPETYSIRSPELFDAIYLKRPIPVELEHYRLVKENDNWGGDDGVGGGADLLRGAIDEVHATYVGFHHFPDEYLRENPTLVPELANRMGYYYTLQRSDYPATVGAGTTLPLSIDWENRGAAPSYAAYELEVRLRRDGDARVIALPFPGGELLPNASASLTHDVPLPGDLDPGAYELAFRIVDNADTGRPIDLALAAEARDEAGFWELGQVTIE